MNPRRARWGEKARTECQPQATSPLPRASDASPGPGHRFGFDIASCHRKGSDFYFILTEYSGWLPGTQVWKRGLGCWYPPQPPSPEGNAGACPSRPFWMGSVKPCAELGVGSCGALRALDACSCVQLHRSASLLCQKISPSAETPTAQHSLL